MLGAYAENYRNQYLAEKDAVFRHYISLHPEDFAAPGMYIGIPDTHTLVYLFCRNISMHPKDFRA
jgi:hypothetical protein